MAKGRKASYDTEKAYALFAKGLTPAGVANELGVEVHTMKKFYENHRQKIKGMISEYKAEIGIRTEEPEQRPEELEQKPEEPEQEPMEAEQEEQDHEEQIEQTEETTMSKTEQNNDKQLLEVLVSLIAMSTDKNLQRVTKAIIEMIEE